MISNLKKLSYFLNVQHRTESFLIAMSFEDTLDFRSVGLCSSAQCIDILEQLTNMRFNHT